MTEAEQRVEDAARAIWASQGVALVEWGQMEPARRKLYVKAAIAALAPTQARIAELEAEVARKDAELKHFEDQRGMCQLQSQPPSPAQAGWDVL
jgi:hypothetical protein